MPLTLVINNSAQGYGVTGYSDASTPAEEAFIGEPVNIETSWGDGEIPVGGRASLALLTSTGVTANFVFTRLGLTTLQLNAFSVVAGGQTLMGASGTVNLNVATIDWDLFDDTVLFAGADQIVGNAFNNHLQGWSGNDRIDGGAGTDTAVLRGFRSAYSLTPTSSVGPDGSDTYVGVERFQFNDVTVAFDTAGTAGQAYRLYRAAFDRTPEASGLGFQIRTLDAGHSLKAVAQNFLNSPEFARKYGGLSDQQYVSQLYLNVLDRAPEAAGLAHHVAALSSGTDRAQMLVNFSESPENQAAVIGVIAGGISYLP